MCRWNEASGVFLLDTGAAASVFDPRFAEAAGVHLGRARQIEGRGGDVAARQGQAVQLALASGPQARIEPVVTDLSEASSAMGVPLAGILGEDFLQGFVLTLNYRGPERHGGGRRRRDPQTPRRSASAARPMSPPGSGSAGARRAGISRSTPAPTPPSSSGPPSPGRRSAMRGAPATSGLGVAGAESTIERGRVDALNVAGRRIVGPQVNFADETPPAADAGPAYAGVIGGPAWNGLVLTLDLPHRRMWLR